jgi:hypothetical protein
MELERLLEVAKKRFFVYFFKKTYMQGFLGYFKGVCKMCLQVHEYGVHVW